jgi:hypothetical protein
MPERLIYWLVALIVVIVLLWLLIRLVGAV